MTLILIGRSLLSLAFFLTAASCFLVQMAVAKQTHDGEGLKKGWRLEQQYTYGKQTVYVCKSGLRIDFPDIHCYLIAKSPTWQVIFYNSQTRNAMVYSYKDYLQHPLSFTYFPARAQTGVKWPSLFAGSRDYAGVEAAQYALPADPNQKSFVVNKKYIGQFLVFNAQDIASEAAEITAKLFKISSSHGGVPLCNEPPKLNLTDNSLLPTKNLGYTNPLKTFSVKEQSLPDKIFEYPVKWTRVSKEVEVSQSKDEAATVLNIFDEPSNNSARPKPK